MLQNLSMQALTQQSTQKISIPKRPLEVQINDLISTKKILNREKLSQQEAIESKLEIEMCHKVMKVHMNELQKKTKIKHSKPPRYSSYRIDYPFSLQQFKSQRQQKRQNFIQIQNDPQVQRDYASVLENYNLFREKKRYFYLMNDPFLSPVQLSQKIREDYENIIEKKGDEIEGEKNEIFYLKPKFTKQPDEGLIKARKGQERRIRDDQNVRHCQNKIKPKMEIGKRHPKKTLPYVKWEKATQNTGLQQAIE